MSNGTAHLKHISQSGMYTSFFEHHPDAVYIVDLEGHYVDTNPATLHMSGYSRDEFLSMSFRDLIIPHDMDQVIRHFNTVASGVPQTFEAAIHHKSGRRIDLDITATPVVLDEQIVGVFGTAKDITERVRVQKVLHEMKERYESLKRYNPNGICSVDFQGRFMGANPAFERLTGYSLNELLKMHAPDIFLPDVKGVNELFQFDAEMQHVEARLRHLDGHLTHVTATIVPIMIDTEMTGFYIIVRDMTELVSVQDLLRQTEKLSAVGQLAAAVAHEIRNPLTALKGFVQLLHHKSDDSDGQYFDIMKGELDRIEMILSELLVLAKPQTVVSIQTQSIKVILQEVITLMSAQAVMKNVLIEPSLDCPKEYVMVKCEENQLKQVFINIIKNGIEAMPNGGPLLVNLRTDNGTVYVEITDHGEGISPDRLRKLGEPFFTTKDKGTGLGFMVSQRIVSAHKGRIDISSAVGTGTTVCIALPLST